MIQHHTKGGIRDPEVEIDGHVLHDHISAPKEAYSAEGKIPVIHSPQDPSRDGKEENPKKTYQNKKKDHRKRFEEEAKIQS